MSTMLVHVLILAWLAWLASSAIPPGYKEYKGLGYYKLYTTGKSWGAAWKTCKDEGSNLLVINSQREADAVKKLYAEYPSTVHDGAWMGVHDLFFENEFVTTLGYPLALAGYTRWHAGEPNNADNNENCVTVHRDGNFNDDVCSRTYPLFCEA